MRAYISKNIQMCLLISSERNRNNAGAKTAPKDRTSEAVFVLLVDGTGGLEGEVLATTGAHLPLQSAT